MTTKFVFTALAALLVALPQPVGRVNDFAGILDAATRQEIDSLVATLEAETTAEVAVATVTSLEGLTVEEYATRLFQEWGLGQKGVDNGVLVVVAPAAREMRIEVGYGLEGVLPDGLAGQIIREDFLPHFRSDDYRTGILQGVRRVVDVVRRNHTLSLEERLALDEPARPSHEWIFVLFMSVFVARGRVGPLGRARAARAEVPARQASREAALAAALGVDGRVAEARAAGGSGGKLMCNF